MLLCTILQRLHLGEDAVGSISVAKVFSELLPDAVNAH